MPLSIISTDYMQLDLLYSFFIVCMDRHKKIQVTNTQIYVCVFLYSMKERAVTGITWLPGGRVRGLGSTFCLKLPPSPCPHLFLGSHFQITRNRTKTKGKREVNR